MKTSSYIHILAAASAALALGACSENSWNDRLDGFEEFENQPITEVKTVEYALTDENYTQIAGDQANKTLAGADKAAALAQVGSLKRFSTEIPASEYALAFLNSTAFPYFTLNDGSAVRLTYNMAENEPAELTAAANAITYEISDQEYIDEVWGEDNYINAFAPSKPASKYIPSILSGNVEAEDGAFCIVSYRMATQEPVFGGSSQPEEPEQFEQTDIIGTLKSGDAAVTIKGLVSAVCTQGYTLTDKSGTIFVYMGSGYDPTTYPIGSQLEVTGDIGDYNKGLQVAGASASVNKYETVAFPYPTPTVLTGAALDQAITRSAPELAVYATITGAVTVTDRNINIKPEGAETAQGSVYGFNDEVKALFTDGAKQTITGYFIAIAGSRYCNMVVTEIDGKTLYQDAAAKAPARAAVSVPTETLNAVYRYTDGRWSVPADFIVLNPADYTAMGQSYPNLSAAEPYLSIYLGKTFSYAAEGNVKYVFWAKYADKQTSYVCSPYICTGNGQWEPNSYVTTETNQFVRNQGKWIFDPNVKINLPYGKTAEFSIPYYQAVVDWVYENICVPLGDNSITSGKFYVTKFGTNEYYSGASAYQNNVDLRGASARGQYPAGYPDDLTDADITELMKHRFFYETFPAALGKLHAADKPIEGLTVNYTITFGAYNGSTTEIYEAVYELVGQGQFKPVSCTWWENGVGNSKPE